MQKYRFGGEPKDFVQVVKPKKKIRGYAVFTQSSFAVRFNNFISLDMDPAFNSANEYGDSGPFISAETRPSRPSRDLASSTTHDYIHLSIYLLNYGIKTPD